MTASVFGVDPDEIRTFTSSFGGTATVRADFPLVRVECAEEGVIEALVHHFGERVYSLSGAGLESVVGGILAASGKTLAIAESCTGGLTGHLITNCPGSSAYFKAGFITYSNDAKTSILGVPEDHLLQHGAVSEAVAVDMVRGALKASGADFAVAVSGIAGPDGGTPEKPVGTVWFAVGSGTEIKTRLKQWNGDREQIKLASACQALDMVRRICIGVQLL